MDKANVIKCVRAALRERYEQMLDAARETSAGATDAESRAEGKYDTRGLEASYLAAGQAEQVEALAAALGALDPASFPDFPEGATIGAGALVEVELAGEMSYFLLAPSAGGVTFEKDGHEVTVLAPDAPLRQKMLGLVAGDTIEQPPVRIVRVS